MRTSASFLPALASIVLAACSGDDFTPRAGGTSGNGGSSGGSGAGASASGAAGAVATAGASGSAAGQGGTNAGGASGGGAAGSSAGVGGNGGDGGATTAGGNGGSDNTAGTAGSGGNAGGGAAGKAGAGGAVDPNACVEVAPPPLTASFRADCAIDPAACVLPTKVAPRAHVTATSCGVAVAHAQAENVIGLTFLERPNVSPTSLPGATFPHGIIMQGARLLVGSSGDLLVGAPAVGVGAAQSTFQFGASATAVNEDGLPYRSIVATKDVIAWTGRQGHEILLIAPDNLGCTTKPTAGGCTEQRSATPGNATLTNPVAGWGVASIDKKVFWSNKTGLHATTLGAPNAPIQSAPRANMVPGALAIIRNQVLMATPKSILVFPPNLGPTTVASAGFVPTVVGEIRDMIAYNNDRLVVLSKGTGKGSLTVENKNLPFGLVTIFSVQMPSDTDPLSVAAGPDAVFVGCADGTVYRFPFES